MTPNPMAKRSALVLSLLALILMSACAQQTTNNANVEPADPCARTDDAALAASVKSALSAKIKSRKWYEAITVQVKDRVVTLGGAVNYEGTKKLAGDTANVACVKSVVNNIQIDATSTACGGSGFKNCCCPDSGCECLHVSICPPCGADVKATSTPAAK